MLCFCVSTTSYGSGTSTTVQYVGFSSKCFFGVIDFRFHSLVGLANLHGSIVSTDGFDKLAQ